MRFLLLFIVSTFLLSDKINFWDIQRKGANSFNEKPINEEYFKKAKELGLEYIRLAYDKFPSKHKDFLLGSADNYKGIIKEDLKVLKNIFKLANKYDIKIVLAPLGLYGTRFAQNNGNKRDIRFYENFKYHKQSIDFYKELAKELKNEKMLYAYNILNEPVPEFKTDISEQASKEDFKAWAKKYKNTAKDITLFYKKVIKAIRSIDKNTPIMLDGTWYANPRTFSTWKKFKDDKILYSFHMYEPYNFTSGANFRKKKGYLYPGSVKFDHKVIYADKKWLQNYLEPFFTWAKKEKINSNRLIAGEFGCMRRNKGCKEYLQDLINIFNENKIHWAFYSFRENWDGYDYEVGTKGFGYKYWKAKEEGKNPKTPRKENSLFDVLKKEFNKDYKVN